MNEREEKLIFGLMVVGLMLMGVYVVLKLKMVKRPAVFVQRVAGSCQVSSCGDCDVNEDGVFNYKDSLALKEALRVGGCGNFEESWNWCSSNCSKPVQRKPAEYACVSKVFGDSGCRVEKWRFTFESNTDKTKGCGEWAAKPGQYVKIRCRKSGS
ncbi:MAG: hypothetical protein GXP43_01270 [bacterium]|nr:hypothetical protein [bacterium]